LSSSEVFAGKTTSSPPPPFGDRLTGDWGGARTTTVERRVTIDVDRTAESITAI
jgi:hypothetical protein